MQRFKGRQAGVLMLLVATAVVFGQPLEQASLSVDPVVCAGSPVAVGYRAGSGSMTESGGSISMYATGDCEHAIPARKLAFARVCSNSRLFCQNSTSWHSINETFPPTAHMALCSLKPLRGGRWGRIARTYAGASDDQVLVLT